MTVSGLWGGVDTNCCYIAHETCSGGGMFDMSHHLDNSTAPAQMVIISKWMIVTYLQY